MDDKAYSSRAHQTFLRERRITAAIGERAEQKGHRLRRAAARGRPISYDRERYNDRNSVERCYERFKQWRGLATRYDKLVVIYRGGAVLRSIILWLRSPIGDTRQGCGSLLRTHAGRLCQNKRDDALGAKPEQNRSGPRSTVVALTCGSTL